MATKRSASQRHAQPAYVLHQHDWSESSLILELFTREQGRIAVVAKGAKRPYSQLRAVLLPFQRLQVLTSVPRGEAQPEVQTLRSAEWTGGGAPLSGSTILTGFYLNELLLKALARHDPHPRLFDAYAETLPALAQHGEADDSTLQSALRAFELVLLRELGVLPQLDLATVTQEPLLPGARYGLRPEVGVVPIGLLQPGSKPAASDGIPAATLAALEAALDARDLTGVRQAARAALTPLRQQLRGLLHHLIGSDRLRSRDAVLDAQRLLAPQPAAQAPSDSSGSAAARIATVTDPSTP